MASAAFSPDPFVGTWKLDREKSRFSIGAPPREMTLQIEQEGDNLRVTAHGSSEDGSPLSVEYSLPIKGGDGQVHHGFFDRVGSKYISDDVRETTYMKKGKERMSRHTVLSHNGRTMRSTVKGTNAHGHFVTGEEVFNRQ
jgi:hypothetical protein